MENYKNTLKLDRTYSIFLIIFAGTPPTTTMGGTSLFTNAPAAITVPSPMVTPAKMVAFEPIQTFLPIRTGQGK